MNKAVWCAFMSSVVLLGCQSVQQTGILRDQEQNYLRTQEGQPLKGFSIPQAKEYYQVPALQAKTTQAVGPALQPPTRWEAAQTTQQANHSQNTSFCHYQAMDDHWQLPCPIDVAFDKVLRDLSKQKYKIVSVQRVQHAILFVDADRLGPVPNHHKRVYRLQLEALKPSLTRVTLQDPTGRSVPWVIMKKISRYLIQADASAEGGLSLF